MEVTSKHLWEERMGDAWCKLQKYPFINTTKIKSIQRIAKVTGNHVYSVQDFHGGKNHKILQNKKGEVRDTVYTVGKLSHGRMDFMSTISILYFPEPALGLEE